GRTMTSDLAANRCARLSGRCCRRTGVGIVWPHSTGNSATMNVFQRIGIGLKAWYWAWFVAGGAEHLATAVGSLGGPAIANAEPKVEAPPAKPTAPPKAAPPPKPPRSDALTLLEALQREARLIDFL